MPVSMPDRFFLGEENVIATSANAGHESEMPSPREGAANTNTTPAGVVTPAAQAPAQEVTEREAPTTVPMSMTTKLLIAAGIAGVVWMLSRTK